MTTKELPADFFDVFADLERSGLAEIRRGYGGWVPEVYDRMEGDFEDDIPLVLDAARKCGSPVADLGCGTGRLTLPLAQDGHHVYAIDSDTMMHDILLRRAGNMASRIKPVRADLTTFSLPEQVAFAVCSTNTFLYLGSLDAQREALLNIHRNLLDEGHLWLDVFVPKPNPSAEEPYLTSQISPDDGTLLLYAAQARDDHFEGVSHVNAFTMLLSHAGTPRIFLQSWKYAWLSPKELRLLLESAGFRLLELLGDYEGGPADESSVQMIAIAEKLGSAGYQARESL